MKNHEYCQYTEQQIRESGLLSPERMAEISVGIDARLGAVFTASAFEIPKVKIAHCKEGALLFSRLDDENSVEFMRRSVLPAVLTSEELTLVNDACCSARERRFNAERFAKAEKLEAWDGGAFLGDDYFSSMDELCDRLENDGEEWPEFVWAARQETVIGRITVEDAVACDIDARGWEDISTDDLDGVAELQAALDKFTATNNAVYSYNPDYKKAVLLAAWKAA